MLFMLEEIGPECGKNRECDRDAPRSPVELGADLAFATRKPGAGHDTEQIAVEITVRIVELRVVENIENFSPNLKGHGFFDDGPLRDAEVRVVQTGTVEELAVRVAKLTQRTGCKGIRQEKSVGTIGPGFTRILDHDLSCEVGNVVS